MATDQQRAIIGVLNGYRGTKKALIDHPYNTGLNTSDESKKEFELLLSRLKPVSALEKNVADMAIVFARGFAGNYSSMSKAFNSLRQESLMLLCGAGPADFLIVGNRHKRFRIVEDNNIYVTRERSVSPTPRVSKKKTRAHPKKNMQPDELSELFGQIVDAGKEEQKPPVEAPVVANFPPLDSIPACPQPSPVPPQLNPPQPTANPAPLLEGSYATAVVLQPTPDSTPPTLGSWADVPND